MKSQKIMFLLGMMVLLTACSGQKIDPTPAVAATLTTSLIAKSTNTIESMPTETVTPLPDSCSKLNVQADALSPVQPDLNQDRLIAFTTGSFSTSGEVFVMGMNGQNPKNITNNPADDIDPGWSPDGKRIAFLSNRNGPTTTPCNGAGDECMYQLFTIKPDGAGLKQITPDWTFHYEWSPDGKQIAFLRAVKSSASPYPNDPFLSEIYVINSDGTHLRNLTNSPGFYPDGPVWSPDGKKIAFISGDMAVHPNSLNVINSDAAGLSAYSDLKPDEVVWAADGKTLIFTSQANDSGNDIYRLKADLASAERLTFTPIATKDYLTLSPDGRWLAYHSRYFDTKSAASCDQIRALNTETLQDYFVYDAHDVGKVPIETNSLPPSYDSLSILSIHWMPNSRQLLFKQMIRVDGIFGEFEESFIIQLGGSGFKYFTGGVIQP